MQIRVNCKDIWFKPIFNRENISKAVYLVSDNEIGFKIGHGKTHTRSWLLDVLEIWPNLTPSRQLNHIAPVWQNFNSLPEFQSQLFWFFSNISDYFQIFPNILNYLDNVRLFIRFRGIWRLKPGHLIYFRYHDGFSVRIHLWKIRNIFSKIRYTDQKSEIWYLLIESVIFWLWDYRSLPVFGIPKKSFWFERLYPYFTSKYTFVITISQIIMVIFDEINDWNLWVIKLTSSLRFLISISGSQIVFVDILQVQMSHRITDIYLTHQCDVIWYIHQWLGRTICQTTRWELTQHVTF